ETAEAEGMVSTTSIEERMNATFRPIVGAMADFLFWDPFSYIGIYDPVVYSDDKVVKSPGWDNPEIDSSIFKSWLVAEGEHVSKGQPIAVVELDGHQEVEVLANTEGILKHKAQSGQYLFNTQKIETNINVGSENIGYITY